jgi:hypothetical protein
MTSSGMSVGIIIDGVNSIVNHIDMCGIIDNHIINDIDIANDFDMT